MMTDEDKPPESKLPPCERFTVLDTRKGGNLQCDVCDQLEGAHQNAGRRTMSGGQIEELRRRIIVERFEMLEAQRQAAAGNGASDGAT